MHFNYRPPTPTQFEQHPDIITTVLIGFNPVELSRNAPIEGWPHTCRDVFTALAEREMQEIQEMDRRQKNDLGETSSKEALATTRSAIVLNPIVGPEAITGSSRMKGGSMTKMLLDAVFLSALTRVSSIINASGMALVCAPAGNAPVPASNISATISATETLNKTPLGPSSQSSQGDAYDEKFAPSGQLNLLRNAYHAAYRLDKHDFVLLNSCTCI